MKSKNVKDIEIGDKVLLLETGFEYVVTFITDKSILVKAGEREYWLPKFYIKIKDSLLSVNGYRLFKLNPLPQWLVDKNNII